MAFVAVLNQLIPRKICTCPEEYLKDCEEGTKGFAHADVSQPEFNFQCFLQVICETCINITWFVFRFAQVAIPWFMHKHHEDIEASNCFQFVCKFVAAAPAAFNCRENLSVQRLKSLGSKLMHKLQLWTSSFKRLNLMAGHNLLTLRGVGIVDFQ